MGRLRDPRALGTNRPEFAQAYDDHVWQVYAFVAYRVGSRSDAEDLTQQTFERALRAGRPLTRRVLR